MSHMMLNHMLQMDAISCIESEEEQRKIRSNHTIKSAGISLTDGKNIRKYNKAVIDTLL